MWADFVILYPVDSELKFVFVCVSAHLCFGGETLGSLMFGRDVVAISQCVRGIYGSVVRQKNKIPSASSTGMHGKYRKYPT